MTNKKEKSNEKKKSNFNWKLGVVFLIGVIVGSAAFQISHMNDAPAAPIEAVDLIFVQPSGCIDLCENLAPQVQELANMAGLDFKVVSINAPNGEVPGLIMIGDDWMTPLIAFDEREQAQKLMCLEFELDALCKAEYYMEQPQEVPEELQTQPMVEIV